MLGLMLSPASVRLDSLLFNIRAKERFGDRYKLFAHFTLVPAEADWMFIKLPAALSFLYVVLRPLRLLQRYGAISLRQLTRQPTNGPFSEKRNPSL